MWLSCVTVSVSRVLSVRLSAHTLFAYGDAAVSRCCERPTALACPNGILRRLTQVSRLQGPDPCALA